MREAASELARDMKARYLQVKHDLEQGRVEYTIPFAPFQLKAVTATSSVNNVWPLTPIAPCDMDERFWLWRGNGGNYQGIPSQYVIEGTSNFLLYWTPNYSYQNGLCIEGYYDCSDWQDMSTECPLGQTYNLAIRRRAEILRCMEMIDDPRYQKRLPIFQTDYDKEHARLYGEAVMHNTRRSIGGPAQYGSQFGAWGAWTWGGGY